MVLDAGVNCNRHVSDEALIDGIQRFRTKYKMSWEYKAPGNCIAGCHGHHHYPEIMTELTVTVMLR